MPVYETKRINTSLHQGVNFKPLTKQKSAQHLSQKVTKGPGHSIAQLQITPTADQNSAEAHSTAQMQDNIMKNSGAVNNGSEIIVQRKWQEQLKDSSSQPIQKKANNTGLPDNLKSGIEHLSGYAMDDVKVHYHSPKPVQLQAHAYAQGTDIHIASGQEKHLPHEAWHVVQQKQGRVKPTTRLKGMVNINDDAGLEKEADDMGAKAIQRRAIPTTFVPLRKSSDTSAVVQRGRKDRGVVPPQTHGRDQEFTSPTNPALETKGQRHVVPRKKLTRFERMIDRIGKILATDTNVHVSVALDDNTLVISANKENTEQYEKLEYTANRLKNIFKGEDPLKNFPENPQKQVDYNHKRVEKDKREKDIGKVKFLLKGGYTDGGIELNEEVSEQLTRLKAAVEKGVITQQEYHKGAVGIYVVPTHNSDQFSDHNMHGELKVGSAIKYKRELTKSFKEQHVYIGGTLADCFACNASHKVLNEQVQGWALYSGGTHGGLFKGYRVSSLVKEQYQKFQLLTGETVEYRKSEIPKVNTERLPTTSFADDSDSETEDYEVISNYAKINRQFQLMVRAFNKGTKELSKLEVTLKNTISKQENMVAELAKLEKDVPELEVKLEELAGEATLRTKESEKLLLELEHKRQAFVQEEASLKDVQVQILNHSKVLNKKQRKGVDTQWDNPPENGIETPEQKVVREEKKRKAHYPASYDLTFASSGEVYRSNWGKTNYPGESDVKLALQNKNYAEVFEQYRKHSEAYAQFEHQQMLLLEESKQKLSTTDKEMVALKMILERFTNLPQILDITEKDIESMAQEKEAKIKGLEGHKEMLAHQEDLKTKASGGPQTVKHKLDWLNQANIDGEAL